MSTVVIEMSCRWQGLKVRTLMLLVILSVVLLIRTNAQNPNWTPPTGSAFQFTANVIAVVELSDVPSNDVGDVIAFFDGNDIRGRGNDVQLTNGTVVHFITLYSNQAADTFSIKVYHAATNQVYEVQPIFLFRSQNVTGSVDEPTVIHIFPGNIAPLSLLPVMPRTQLDGYPFDEIDMNDYLIQPEGALVQWGYTPNPNLLVNFTGSVLQVSAVNGFTGQTQLVVSATNLNTFNAQSRGGSTDRSAIGAPAETTITFNVTPIYPAPLWEPAIPGQGIVTGSKFDSIPLHDFENQFTGPKITYDYIPIIEEAQPNEIKPSWQVTQSFGSTMSVVARLDYTPKYQFHSDDDLLVAMVNGEVRGVATRDSENGLYYLSVGGSPMIGDPVELKLYSSAMKRILSIDSAFFFEPYAIMGSDELPTVFEFAPIVPVVPYEPVTNGIYTMPVNILQAGFIGYASFTFFARDPVYPQYLFDQTNATFCIVTDSSELTIYYEDADGDGLGNPLSFTYNCTQPTGYVTNNEDCNDGEATASAFALVITENSGIANDGFVCPSTSVTIAVDQIASGYLWSTGQTTQSIDVNPGSTTIYSVTVTTGSACNDVLVDTIFVEGKIVKNSANAGFNSLRNVLECLSENDTISYDLPNVQGTTLTEALNFNKNVVIIGSLTLRPHIFIDFNAATNGMIIQTGKTLSLKDIDIEAIGLTSQSVISGSGTLEISGETHISNQ
ncbi:MAG: hypothetical protein KDC49_14895 [Saprospiraceae bacterium]|nr:hypothetical protein [Saprospiraceae bacterium]